MKTLSYIFKTSLVAGAFLALATSCTEEKIYGLDPNGIPLASDYSISMDVNQETNEFTLSFDDSYKGVYPIWSVYANPNNLTVPSARSTNHVVKGVIKKAGEYDVELRVGNRNGISEAPITAVIKINKDLGSQNAFKGYKYDSEFNMWKTANVTLQSTWFANNDWGEIAAPEVDVTNESITLHTPAEMGDSQWQGQVHVGTDIVVSPDETYDFSCYLEAQIDSKVTVKVQKDGDDETYFVADIQPFKAGGDVYHFSGLPGFEGNLKIAFDFGGNQDTDFAISNIVFKNHKDDDGTVWPSEGTPTFDGFNYDSDFNMWKKGEISLQSTWFANNDWGEIAAPDVQVSNEYITLHTPADMGGQQWQGQVHVGTNIEVSAAETYDFSCWVTADNDSKVTVKVQKDGDDETYFVADQQSFTAGGSCFWFSDLAGFDGTLKIAFDFGGNPDMDFEISRIVFKKHSDDDGSVLPSDTPGDDPSQSVSWVDVNSDANIWNSAVLSENTTWTSPSDWSGNCAEPTIVENGNYFELTYSEAPGSDQWQAQFALHSNLSFPGDKLYDFRVTISPTCDITGVTVKPTVEDDDNTFWSDARHDVYAYEDNVISLVGVSAEIPQLKIVFDFAGVEAGATVIVKDIIIQEHTAPAAFSWVDVNSNENFWNSANLDPWTAWTANNDWGEISNPTVTEDGNYYELTYSEAPGGSQWQAQFALHSDLSFPGDKEYDFRVTINPSCDITGVTVKPTVEDDDNTFWSDARHDVYAYEDNIIELKGVSAEIPKLKIVFDFAGVEAGASVIVKDIIIQEHK